MATQPPHDVQINYDYQNETNKYVLSEVQYNKFLKIKEVSKKLLDDIEKDSNPFTWFSTFVKLRELIPRED